MANKGNSRHTKRLAASSYQKIRRKVTKYVMKPMPGRHNGSRSIALSTLIREKLNYASNAHEARQIIKKGMVKVNGKVVKEEKFAVGFGDVLDIGGNIFTIDVGRNNVISIGKGAGSNKVLHKVAGKYVANGGKIMIKLYNGDVVAGNNDIKTNDSVVVSDGKIEKVLKFEKGASCKVISGIHASETGKISAINAGSAASKATVEIEGSNGKFETLADNIMVIE